MMKGKLSEIIVDNIKGDSLIKGEQGIRVEGFKQIGPQP